MAHETENVVHFTKLPLNAFCPNNNNASQSWPTVHLAVPLCACTGQLVQHCSNCACTGQLVQHYTNCACTGLLVQHYSNCACTGLLVQHYSNCACTGLLVQHYSNCACTGLLVQHSLPLITINSNLTQGTDGAVQMFTNIYTIICQWTTVHIVTHSAIPKQETYPTHNTLYHNQQ